MDIFRIMAAILKLGNVNFIPTTNMDGTEGCAISNDYGELFSWEHDQDGGLSIHTNTRETLDGFVNPNWAVKMQFLGGKGRNL